MKTTWADGGFVAAVRRARTMVAYGMEIEAIQEKLIEDGLDAITSHCVCVIVRAELRRGEI
jgi:hypothetical protein